MNKTGIIALCAIAMIALVVGANVAEAQIVVYLPSFIVSALASVGITYVAVGVAVIAGGYLVYHVSSSAYSYFTAYKYYYVSDHAYIHAAEFPNIWGSSIPSKTTFNNKCRDNMNSKSNLKYIQKYDKRLISYNPTTRMVTVGDTDGKTVITCFPKPKADVDKKVATGEWIKVTVR
jgi:hypothetical protein